MAQEAVADLRDVHQPVLMDADVHKCPKIDNVAHRALQLHAGLQVLKAHHVGAQQRRGQLVARVTAGAQQLLHHVAQRRLAHAHPARGLRKADLRHVAAQVAERAAAHVLQAAAAQREQRFRRRIALRVHGRVIQHAAALRHAQKTGALLERARPELRHLAQRGAARERAVFLAVGHDVLRHGGRKAGNLPQQAGRGRVQVHAHGVHAVLHHAVQRLAELLRRHVVLILPDADGLRVDLHELGQRVLQPPGDGDGAAQRHVERRELRGGQRAGAVHGGPRLAHDGVGRGGPALLPQGGEHIRGEDLRLARGRAVADGDGLHAVLLNPPAQRAGGLLAPRLRVRGIDHARVQHTAGRVHHGGLAAGAVAGVQAQHRPPAHGRLHEQLAQVQPEDADGRFVRLLREGSTDLALERGEDQPVKRIVRGQPHLLRARRGAAHTAVLHERQRAFPIPRDGDLQEALALAAVHGQHAVACRLPHRLAELIVRRIDGILLRLRCLGDELRLRHGRRAQPPAQRCVVGDALGQNVARPGQRVLRRLHALLRVHIPRRRGRRVHGALLPEEAVRQRLQPLLPRHGGACAPLRAERAVKVLQLRHRGGRFQGILDLRRERPGGLNQIAHLAAPLFEAPQRFQPLRQAAQRLVIQAAVRLLAVPRDEGDRVPLVDEGNHLLRLPLLQGKLRRQLLGKLHSQPTPFALHHTRKRPPPQK